MRNKTDFCYRFALTTMKNLFTILLTILSPFIVLAKGFVVTGNIEGLQAGVALLTYTDAGGKDTTVTTIVANGKFTFAGKAAEPALATLKITEGWGYNFDFFLENANINISLVKDASEKTVITGSA